VEQTLSVSVFGSTGYTASELLRVLSGHPHVRIVNLISSSNAGRRVSEVLPPLSPIFGDELFCSEPREDYELAFLCLPHEVSMELVPSLLQQGKRVIDLSGAYRIREERAYEEFYGFEHKYVQVLKEAVYGLPELFRRDISSANLVANPGCYPTATLLGAYPLLREVKVNEIIVHAVSGVSGAGRKPRQHFHFPEMDDNFFVYSVEKHRHTPEIEDALLRSLGIELKVRFTPMVVPSSRGMVATLYIKAPKIDLKELYIETYRFEPFVFVTDSPPMTKWVSGTNNCYLYPTYDERTSTAVIVSVIDNLGKGASLQAIQNMNIMFGFEEELSLPKIPIFP